MASRRFHRIVEWGDGWLPVIRKVSQLSDGINQLQALCEACGRDPQSIRVTELGAENQ